MSKRQKSVVPLRRLVYSPLRSLGDVLSLVPLCVGALGSTFYVATAVAQNVLVFDANTLHLNFHFRVHSHVTALAARHGELYVAYGSSVGVYKRGKCVWELDVDTAHLPIKRIVPLGKYVVLAGSQLVVVLKQQEDSTPALYSTIPINSLLGQVVDMIHPPTYLNKVVVATQHNLVVVNVQRAKVVYTSPDFAHPVLLLTLAPVLDYVGVGHTTGHVLVYNVKKGKLVREISCGDLRVLAVLFRSDGLPHLMASLTNGDLFFYDLDRRLRVHVLRQAHRASAGGVASAQFLAGQPVVVTNGGDNQLKEYVFDPSVGKSLVVSPPRFLRGRGGHLAPPLHVAFQLETGHHLLSALRDLSFWLFSLRKDAQAFEMLQKRKSTYADKTGGGKLPEVVALAVLYTPTDFADVVTAHSGLPYAVLWHSKMKRLGEHMFHTVDKTAATAVAITQCGHFALVGSAGGVISSFNIQLGIARKRYTLHKKQVTGVAVDGMNRNMVLCGLDGLVGFYDYLELLFLGKLQLGAPITHMAYHRTSDLAAFVTDDLTIHVVDVVTRRVVRQLVGHGNRITAIDFSPNGRWLVLASLDATIRTWDLPTGNVIDGIRVGDVATCVKFAPTGDVLVLTHVRGNGVCVWTNRAQFRAVPVRMLEEEEYVEVDVGRVLAAGTTGVLDGAYEQGGNEDDELVTYTLPAQLDPLLVTLSDGPRLRLDTLVHMEAIRKRNKPVEPPKKPEKAPFFLDLKGEAVGDRAIVAEKLGEEEVGLKVMAQLSKLNAGSGDGDVEMDAGDEVAPRAQFELVFTQRLREGAALGDYALFLAYLVSLSPSGVDLEIRLVDAGSSELAWFVDAMVAGVVLNGNYELYEAFVAIAFRAHADVLYLLRDLELKGALERWRREQATRGDRLAELVRYCSAVSAFVTSA